MGETLFADAASPSRAALLWPLVLPLAVGLIGVYLLLPRARRYPPLWGAVASGLALVLAGWFLIWGRAAPVEAIFFYAFAGIAILSGGLLITQRNPVHAALSFAMVVLSTCGLFLLQAAPFLMAATVIVYAGAIVVTFLFVIMLAKQEGLSDADQRSREPLLSTIAGFVLLGTLLYLLNRTYDTRPLDGLLARTADAAGQDSAREIAVALGNEEQYFAEFKRELENARPSSDRDTLEDNLLMVRATWPDWKQKRDGPAMKEALARLYRAGALVRDGNGVLQPHAVTSDAMSKLSVPPPALAGSRENIAPLGRSLFTDYLLPVELGGILLLAATIGAIAIAGRRPEGLR